MNQHRNINFFSDTSIGYNYSGKLMKSQPLTKHLKTLMQIINIYFNSDYNAILVNHYVNGQNYIGAHSDNEENLGKTSGVVCLSYGESRTFRIRNKDSKKIVLDIPTVSNDIIKMNGDFQKEFTHEIPMQTKITGERYSFTFRKHNI